MIATMAKIFGYTEPSHYVAFHNQNCIGRSEKVGLALAGRAMACAGVADVDGGAVAGLEDWRPVIKAHGGMADRLAQALGRLPAEPLAEAGDPSRFNPVAARRLMSGLGFDQFDPGRDVDAIGAAFGGDPHGNAIRNS